MTASPADHQPLDQSAVLLATVDCVAQPLRLRLAAMGPRFASPASRAGGVIGGRRESLPVLQGGEVRVLHVATEFEQRIEALTALRRRTGELRTPRLA